LPVGILVETLAVELVVFLAVVDVSARTPGVM
jgi:hypothetical protein